MPYFKRRARVQEGGAPLRAGCRNGCRRHGDTARSVARHSRERWASWSAGLSNNRRGTRPWRLSAAPLVAVADELQEALARYQLPPDGVGRGPIADCEIQVVRREWNRISRSGCSPRSLEDLVLEWCAERLRGLFFSPVESRMGETDAAERLAKVESMENVVRTLLKTEQSDIVQALVRDPSGSRVRQPRATQKAATADLLLEPIPVPMEAAR